jgi:hypothetical protein
MHVAVMTDAQAAVVNEVAPILVFGLAFVIALGGAYAAAVMICGWGHVGSTQVDFWKAQVKIQCK